MCRKKREEKKKEKEGYGLIDYIVNRLPEIHIPGYQYCGPGTQLEKRLARGDPGVNPLDRACKLHDIAYSTVQNSKGRRQADKNLVTQALPRIYSRDAKLGERAAALLVSGLIGAKIGLSKIGLGIDSRAGERKRRKSKKMKIMQRQRSGGSGEKKRHRRRQTKKKRKGGIRKKSISFGKLVRGVRASIQKPEVKSSSENDLIKAAIRSAKDAKQNKTVKKIPRILKLPKFGGTIAPILPLLSALGSIGTITSSALGIAKTFKKIEHAKTRMNGKSEKKIGRGLYLKRNAKGSGFYLKPYQPQHRQRQHH